MNEGLEKDIAELISHKHYFEPFEESSVLVTGATGLLGSILIKSLLRYAVANDRKITVYAACRSKEKFEAVFDGYLGDSLVPLFSDICKLNTSDLQIDYIIHGASVTDSMTFVEKPVETIDTALDGTRNLLRQCVGKNMRGFVYLSSLEVYGTFPGCEGITYVTEKDFGYIDPLSVRASYSEGKRMAENICAAYAKEFGVPIKIARLCQTFGAGVAYDDNRVFAQFARAVIDRKDIILKTKGETVRNYCYTTDAASGILTVLVRGKVGEAYNVANTNSTISIVGMAQLFCDLLSQSGSKVVFDIADDAEKLGYNPVVKMRLDSSRTAALGWKAEVPLKEMCMRLVEGMRQNV